jgi:hypothetical protein
MKSYKPYLSLSKNDKNYKLEVVILAGKDQTITNIRQDEVKKGNELYWGVILTLSDAVRLVNGSDNPVFSATIDIATDKSVNYKKILCCAEVSFSDGNYGPPASEDTAVDFDDAGH